MTEKGTEPLTSYDLKPFTPKTLESTKKDWEKIAGGDEFATEYGFVFEWAGQHIDYDNGHNDSLAYGLFKTKSTKASAIVEVIQRMQARKGLTKMLKLWITPQYWDTETHRMEIASIMIHSILGTMVLSKQNQSKTVKIYGRTSQMLSILHTVHTMFSEMIAKGDAPGVAVNIVSRWLEFKLVETEEEK